MAVNCREWAPPPQLVCMKQKQLIMLDLLTLNTLLLFSNLRVETIRKDIKEDFTLQCFEMVDEKFFGLLSKNGKFLFWAINPEKTIRTHVFLYYNINT